MFLEFPID